MLPSVVSGAIVSASPAVRKRRNIEVLMELILLAAHEIECQFFTKGRPDGCNDSPERRDGDEDCARVPTASARLTMHMQSSVARPRTPPISTMRSDSRGSYGER